MRYVMRCGMCLVNTLVQRLFDRLSRRLHDGNKGIIRVILAKPGLDGHDRGVKVIAGRFGRGNGGYLYRASANAAKNRHCS